jgi:phosphoenolpyruvate carboxylase
VYERRLAALKARRNSLATLRLSETNAKVQQDLDVLISSQDRAIEGTQVSHQYLLNVVDAASIMNFGLSGLLDVRNKPERQALALVRLKRYAGLEAGYEPLVALAMARTQEELARSGLVGPYVEELKQQLARTDYFLKGISY